MQYLSLKELCGFLSVSTATGRNWIAQGKLNPSKTSGSIPLFSVEYAAEYRDRLLSEEEYALKSRRNKTYVTGNNIYSSYLATDSPNYALVSHLSSFLKDTAPSEELISLLLAECALRLLMKALPECLRTYDTDADASGTPNMLLKNSVLQQTHNEHPLLLAYLSAPDTFSAISPLIDDLIPDKEQARELLLQREELFLLPVSYVPFEDTLGFLYLSSKQLNSRKSSGSYYTPAHIVKRLLSDLSPAMQQERKNMEFSVLDPSCGTGSFLLHLPESIPLSAIHGNDTDSIAVALTRINLLLRQASIGDCHSAKHAHSTVSCKESGEAISKHIQDTQYMQHIQILQHNIRTTDFLLREDADTYTFILGNPPWGSSFSKEEKTLLRQRFFCASHAKSESYDLFLEQSLRHLSTGGFLSFVLPEAVLTVKAHTKIRSLLLSGTSICTLTHLGNCFGGVFCPSIMLTLQKTDTAHSCIGMHVTAPEQTSFTIKKERMLSAEGFCLFSDDASYSLMAKLLATPNCTYLKDNADFALGIVTGDNRAKLRPIAAEPEPINPQDIRRTSVIPVLRGSDILPYHITAPAQALAVPLSACQQTAPEALYYAPEKLLYRFISSRLVFAYDTERHVPLNSCNVVIPHIEELSMPYILAVLNSRCIQFLCHEKFRSLKVLRSHLEQLPIPVASKKEQEELLPLIALLQKEPYGTALWQTVYEQLENQIAALFCLTEKEINIVKKAAAYPFENRSSDSMSQRIRS